MLTLTSGEVDMSGKNRINTIVDDEAKNVLVQHQLSKGFRTRDEALEDILHEFPKLKAKASDAEARLG
jgi:hypothetical protein